MPPGVNDAGSKFAAGINDAVGSKFAADDSDDNTPLPTPYSTLNISLKKKIIYKCNLLVNSVSTNVKSSVSTFVSVWHRCQ